VVRNKQIGGTINKRQEKKLQKAIDILQNRDFCVLTGAGISTDSGIPDYRGMGSAPKKPLDFEPFTKDAEYRKDFWIEGYQDWKDLSPAEPNDAHLAIAQLERAGFVNGVITQNVDALHYRADSEIVAELHGNMYITECLACGHLVSTRDVIEKLELGNPSLLTDNVDRKNFWVPNCEVCTSIIKPAVVFFGEGLPEKPFELATEIAHDAEAMIIAGTSMNVMTPFGFVQMMKSAGKPIIIINKGKTMVDSMADVKIEMSISEAFVAITNSLQSKVYI